jgi:thiamine biosynthesis lipoprotein
MNRVQFSAMGTTVVATGADTSRVEGFFASVEAIFSRFDASSELSLLNENPDEEVEVSRTLAACLHMAAELRQRTDGLIEPAVGGAVIDWGYDRTFAEVLDRDEAPDPSVVGDWSIRGTVVRRSPGTRLDLGGIAKGWTADRAVELGIADMVSAGGDIRSNRSGTRVAIADPWGDIVTQVEIGQGGLATSCSTRRRWRVGDAVVHHIIDPRRLQPAQTPIFSATVAAGTAVEAEAGAKAVLLYGEHGLVWAERQDWIDAALVVWHDGNVYATTGWATAA